MGYFILKMVPEIRARSGIVVSQRDDVEACLYFLLIVDSFIIPCLKLVCFFLTLILFIIPHFIEILRTKFLLRWVECNVPYLIILYLCFPEVFILIYKLIYYLLLVIIINIICATIICYLV